MATLEELFPEEGGEGKSRGSIEDLFGPDPEPSNEHIASANEKSAEMLVSPEFREFATKFATGQKIDPLESAFKATIYVGSSILAPQITALKALGPLGNFVEPIVRGTASFGVASAVSEVPGLVRGEKTPTESLKTIGGDMKTSAIFDSALGGMGLVAKGTVKGLTKVSGRLPKLERLKGIQKSLGPQVKKTEMEAQKLAQTQKTMRVEQLGEVYDQIEGEILNSKRVLTKGMSRAVSKTKTKLGSEYKKLLDSELGSLPVNIDEELSILGDLLGLSGALKGKANKIEKILDAIGSADELSDVQRAIKPGEATVKSAHILKQHLSTLKKNIANGNVPADKTVLMPVLPDVIQSLITKIDDAVPDVGYRNLSRQYANVLATEEFLGTTFGKISKLPTIKGTRQKLNKVMDKLIKEGEVLGEEIFESASNEILGINNQIAILKETGDPKLIKFAEGLETRVKKMGQLAYKRGAVKRSLDNIQTYADDFLTDNAAITDKLKTEIAAEIAANENLIAKSGQNDLLAIGFIGSGLAGTAALTGHPQIAAGIGMASTAMMVAKYSGKGANFTKKFIDDLQGLVKRSNLDIATKATVGNYLKYTLSRIEETSENLDNN